MQPISHRGLWHALDERNTLAAFQRSFDARLGAEIDVRDLDGELVVSHDPPRAGDLPFSTVIAAHQAAGSPGTLAINVKADGLLSPLQDVLSETPRWFAFDMSVPDAVQFSRNDVPFFTRQSEYESHPSLLAESSGVWLDCFESDWIEESTVTEHLEAGRSVCLVSPELHRRDHEGVWTSWASWDVVAHDCLFVCTDRPLEALEVLR